MKKFAIPLACAALLPLTSQAASVILRTGVDGSLSTLAAATSDPYWTISVDGSTFNPAVVLFPAGMCCGMETAGSQATWISDITAVDDPTTGWSEPVVRVRREFDLSGFTLGSVSLSGTYRVADGRRGVYLNGNYLGYDDSAFAFSSDNPISVAPGSPFFVAGINTIEFRGSTVNAIYDGFWVDVTVTDEISGTPEPMTMLLAGAGLLTVGLRRAILAR